MSRFKVGLTGGIASGKTTVSNLFAELGVSVVDADLIARQVVAPGSEALSMIREHFGAAIFSDNGHLDRRQLRQLIFSQPDQKRWLDELLHPRIRAELIRQAKAAPGDYCIVAIPLLVENQLQSLVDRVLVVDVPPSLQIQRVQERDNVDYQHAERILASQASRTDRLSVADDVIENTGNLTDLKSRVQALHQQYRALAG